MNLCDNVNSNNKQLKRSILGYTMSSETGSGSTRNPEGLFAGYEPDAVPPSAGQQPGLSILEEMDRERGVAPMPGTAGTPSLSPLGPSRPSVEEASVATASRVPVPPSTGNTADDSGV